MTDPLDHPAEGPEQEITSDAEALLERAAKAQPEPKVPESGSDKKSEPESFPEPAPKLERLQKILAQAGIASRRHAEELITEGRVQVNGQTVTVLGAKADLTRDHIRVDGKLLHGAERLRYFMLNKPKGYVTTVSDPEGRPTVMEFFAKLGERLYPVGRLDYLSEGLLLVTNDGPLANDLTRAANAVEKTYLVKVAGEPTEENLDLLRTGVTITRGSTNPAAPPVRKGAAKVRTAPARIKQIRAGNNPWFEVVLTEGRNRELRKMFEEIGHHVEKIRRVGYGPLALDVEPGKIRELEHREIEALRLTAAGKLKPRRLRTTYMLPKEAGMTTEEREQKRDARKVRNLRGKPLWKKTGPASDRPAETRPEKPGFGDARFRSPKPGFERPQRTVRPYRDDGPRREAPPRFDRPARTEQPRFDRSQRPPRTGHSDRPHVGRDDRPRFDRGTRPNAERSGSSRFGRGERPNVGRSERPRPERSEFSRPAPGDRPKFSGRPPQGRRFDRPAGAGGENRGGQRTFRPGPKPGFTGKPKFGGRPRLEISEYSPTEGSTGRKSTPRELSGPPARSGSGPRPGGKPGFAGRPKSTGKPGKGGKPAFGDKRSGPKSGSKFGAKSGPKSGGRPAGKSGSKFGGKSGPRPGGKPPGKFGQKLRGKPGGRPPGKRRG